jgi:drug/metabolite transporter (DMT)-like permease
MWLKLKSSQGKGVGAMLSPSAVEGPSRFVAIVEGIIATLIWASSFVFVKMALADLGPLTVAGLRYFLGFLVLVPFVVRNGNVDCPLPLSLWLRLFLIGLSAYTIGNGALFWGLQYLPATTTSFLMGLLPLLILFSGIIWLKEWPVRCQNFWDKNSLKIKETFLSLLDDM